MITSDTIKYSETTKGKIGAVKTELTLSLEANVHGSQEWNDEIKTAFRPRLLRFPKNSEKDRDNQNRFLYFDFDLLMTNPLFTGKVKEKDVLKLYQLAVKNSRLVKQIDRHILFLDRSLQFIRPGGRMAIVIPQVL